MKMLSKYKFSLASLAIVVAVVGIVGWKSIVATVIYAGIAGLVLGGVVVLGMFLWICFEMVRYILEKSNPNQ